MASIKVNDVKTGEGETPSVKTPEAARAARVAGASQVAPAAGPADGWLLLAILAVGLGLRLQHLRHTIDGIHVFRQGHVASNIYYYLQDGITVPATMAAKNLAYRVFDFPLYQMLVAWLCRTFHSDIVLTGRLVNIGIYLLECLVLSRIMVRLAVPSRVRLLALALFSVAPLDVFFQRAILPDNLAILCSFVSLWCFLEWRRRAAPWWPWLLGMVTAGVVSALIKNPATLPVLVSMLAFVWTRRDRRALPGMALYLVALGATVIGFKLYTNFVNVHSFRTPAWEYDWYFSNPHDRLRPLLYARLIVRTALQAVNPLFSLLSVWGVWHYVRHQAAGEQKAVFVGWLLGNAAATLIFFNVNVIHDYYQLPLVFVLCFFAAVGLDMLYLRVQGLTTHRGSTPMWLPSGAATLLAVVALGTAHVFALRTNEPEALIAGGRLIQARTPPGSFIFYDLSASDWDPSPLYFARREGLNVTRRDLGQPGFLPREVTAYGSRYHEFYLFVPAGLSRDVSPQTLPSGATPVVRTADGTLIRLG